VYAEVELFIERSDPMAKQQEDRPGTAPPPSPEQIAERAYQRFVERGGEPGREVEDWLEAERELRASHAPPADEPRTGGRKSGRKSAA
jgi:hypothetical protein